MNVFTAYFCGNCSTTLSGRRSPVRFAAAVLGLLAGAAAANVAGATNADDIFTGAFELTADEAMTSVAPCEPSGAGRDYPVGDAAGQIPSLDQVPWEDLGPGDTVRIYYRPQPYAGKFSITAHGTAAAPVRVCGVKGPNGERPIIDGDGATTRPGLGFGRDSGSMILQRLSLIVIVASADDEGTRPPTWVQIDGLKLQRAQPAYGFTAADGSHQTYASSTACIRIHRGQHIVIADNEITDCSLAIFSLSQDGSDATITRDIRIMGNDMYGHGTAGSYLDHTTYIQSVGVRYEFNRYGPLRAGAIGNSIKDRSVGSVVRFNRIEAGAYAIDMVEAEDYPETALADPAYRVAYVYGNQIAKSGALAIHYGGDKGNETIYRKGTLYFFNNTVSMLDSPEIGAYLFRISTTEEHASVWNNVFAFAPGIQFPAFRTNQDVGPGYTSGGIVDLGVNWVDARWGDGDPYHPVGGALNGTENLVTGDSAPFDPATMVPLAGGAAVDGAQPQLPQALGYPVDHQIDAAMGVWPRAVDGSAMDLGAVER